MVDGGEQAGTVDRPAKDPDHRPFYILAMPERDVVRDDATRLKASVDGTWQHWWRLSSGAASSPTLSSNEGAAAVTSIDNLAGNTTSKTTSARRLGRHWPWSRTRVDR
jgi:hypothetical protein